MYFFGLKWFMLFQVSMVSFSGIDNRAVVDVKDEHFEKGEIVKLNTEWEFYWNKLYHPGDFRKKQIKPDLYVTPSSWNSLVVDGQPCGSFGYATYRIRITNLPGKELLLNAYSLQTACKIFINDSLVVEVGSVGASATESVPGNRDLQIIIPAKYKSIDLIVQVSNFHHRKGGFILPFELGDPETLILQHQVFYILDAVESTALIIIGLFLMALYIFRRKDKSVLYFSLFCITLGFRPVIAVNYMLGTFLPWLNWSVMVKLEYMGAIAPGLFMLLFIRKLFPDQLSKRMVSFFLPVFLFMLAIVVFAPIWMVSWLVYPIMIIIPIGIIILTYAIIKAVIAKVDGAKIAGLGIIILFISLILKILSYAGIIPTIHVLITVMDIIFIFTMSLILGSRFSKQFVKVETLQEQTELQKLEIEVKNKEILDSINYAKRLQSAILPPEKLIYSNFPESFIFYLPKDIVAGDFYWMQELKKGDDKFVLLAVCDCTGHGVPGAMVSVVCNNALNRSVREFGLTDPGKILDKTRELVIAEFEKADEKVKDGMDISLCQFQFSGNKISNFLWAGANNPLWYIVNGELNEIKPDKKPIGLSDDLSPFHSHPVQIDQGGWLYLITDGYADQFGGALPGSVGGKKLKGANFKKLLLEFYTLSPGEQKEKLEDSFIRWKGDLEQLDDVCVIGIKI